MKNKPLPPEWDLSDLYQGINDPKVEQDRQSLLKETTVFTNKYKNTIDLPTITAQHFYQALNQYVQILEQTRILGAYADLLHAKDATSENIGHFYQDISEFLNQINTQLVWFDLEWTNLDEDIASKILQAPLVKKYQHALRLTRVFKPYRLSENEEKIMVQKSQTGSEAFTRLYDEVSSRLRFSLNIAGQKKIISLSEITPYLTVHPNRNLRHRAIDSVTQGLKNNSHIFTYLLNTTLLEKKVDDTIRNFAYPEQSTYLSCEIDPTIVDKMVISVTKNYHLVERFYNAKKKLLGLKQLYEWDRYSPLYPHETTYTWSQAQTIILDSFGRFSSEFASIAKLFFTNNWIDAAITPGKINGAFCSYVSPSIHPYVFVNYSGKINDVMTLAHELGHGIHGYLARKNNLLEFDSSTVIAEIASIFGETLVFEKLYASIIDKKQKINILADKIQESFASIFRQNAFFLFEKEIHRQRRQKGELTVNNFNQLYQKYLQAMFGRGLQLTNSHQYWWMPVLHFYHYNFYVFSYVFGETLTNSLYAIYKNQGQSFVKKYILALSDGGSKSPSQLASAMGINLADPQFWDKGIKLVEDRIIEFENLTASS